MGVSSSTASGSRTSQLQNDIKYLGDRFPFGDEELLLVYRAYQRLVVDDSAMLSNSEQTLGPVEENQKNPQQQPVPRRLSFLTDIAMMTLEEQSKLKKNHPPTSSTTSVTVENLDSQIDERNILLDVVEQKILPPNFGNTLYRKCFLRSNDTSMYDRDSEAMEEIPVDDYTRMARLEKFFEGLSDGTRRGTKASLLCLFRCCMPCQPSFNQNKTRTEIPSDFVASNFDYKSSQGTGSGAATSYIQPLEFVSLGYRIALAAAFLKATTTPKTSTTEDDDDQVDVSKFIPPMEDSDIAPGLQALANSLAEVALKRQQRLYRRATPYTQSDLHDQLVDEEDVLEWAEQVGPMFGSILPTFLHLIFFPNKPTPPSRTSFDYPQISQESSVFSNGNSPLLFSFGCMSSALGGEYFRLYTSASDGLSFNRLQNALLGYGGPTLLVIQSGTSTFGAFTASPWKESKDFYGNHDCFLYRLCPGTIAVYRPTGQSNNFMYCNSFARSRGYDQQAHGIGFGGTVDQPRLFLAESFDECRAARDDLTFEKGSLLGTSFDGLGGGNSATFEIDNLEVWAVGGTEVVQESLQARTLSRDIRSAAIQKARKVDKAAFLDDFKTGLIESKAFAHRQQIQGREGACIDEEQAKYHYEK
ncbi:TLD domain containing protein [Nitzschia inconspicua]|uniref:Oxidation resistance protein 1 n=1 Tax=Nitzschia inconspicua TaxID=303405 RepID=A0A9K3KRT4_9STRA|nr:TLD domain containing protein [Nitzschia inconspicua]